jgi:hypothetical protein
METDRYHDYATAVAAARKRRRRRRLHQSGPGEAPNSCRQTMSRSDLRLVRLKHVDRSIYHRVNSDDSIHLLYENY